MQRAGVEGLAVRTRVNVLMMVAGAAFPLPRRDGSGQHLMPLNITVLRPGGLGMKKSWWH